MANYSLAVGTQFQPFTYQELMAPVAASTEAHMKSEQELSGLQATSANLRNRALAEPNEEWSKKYLEYADYLDNAANTLATQGLSPNVRNQLLQARKDYFNYVAPAQQALAKQQAITEYQFKQDPSKRMVFGDLPTIQQLIANPELNPVGYSGSDVYGSALKTGQSAAKKKVREYIKHSPSLAGYIEQWKEVGYKQGDIERFRRDNPEIAKLVDTIKDEYGQFDGLNKKGKDKMEAEIIKGLYDGALYDNERKVIFDQYQAELREAARKAKEKEANIERVPAPMVDLAQRSYVTGNTDYDAKQAVQEANRQKFLNKHKEVLDKLEYLEKLRVADNKKDYDEVPQNLLSSAEMRKLKRDMPGLISGDNPTYGNVKKALYHYYNNYRPGGITKNSSIYDVKRGRELYTSYVGEETEKAIRNALSNAEIVDHEWKDGKLVPKKGFWGGKEKKNIFRESSDETGLSNFKLVNNPLNGTVYMEAQEGNKTIKFPLPKNVNENVVTNLFINNEEQRKIVEAASKGKLAEYYNKQYGTHFDEDEAMYMMNQEWPNLINEYRALAADLFPTNKHEATKNTSVTR